MWLTFEDNSSTFEDNCNIPTNPFGRNCVSKLTANRDPQRGLVLLVQNTVSRLAQDFLLEAGVTLVTNVKQSVMNRIERSTRAKPVNYIGGKSDIVLARRHA